MGDLKRQLLHYAWLAWRRRWLVLAIAWPLCAIGWIGVAMVPDKYVATARIYVDTETLLAPLLKGIAVDVDMNQQIEVMQRTLLSRPNLEKVVRMTDLDLGLRTADERDRLLSRLAATTIVRPEGVHNLFAVEYSNGDPATAYAVVQALLTIFVEANLGNSRRDMEQARRFIEDQIKSYESQLATAEQRLAEYKREHMELTDGAGTVGGRLDAARARLLQLRGELEDANTRRAALRAEFERVPELIEQDGGPQVVINGERRSPTELETRILQLQKTLDDLQLRYTDQHPDVIAARRMLAELKDQQAKMGAGLAGGDGSATPSLGAPVKQKVANQVHAQIQLKLIELESDIQTLERRVAGQQAEVDRLVELSNSAPGAEAALASLNRDYTVLKRNYEEMLARRESAKLSQNLDSSSEKVEFRIVDPPVKPLRPSSPNRPMLLTAVLILALAAGLAVPLVLAQLDESCCTVRMLRETAAHPVLGGITVVLSPRERRRAAASAGAFMAGMGALLLAYGVVVVTFVGDPVRSRILNSILQPVRHLI